MPDLDVALNIEESFMPWFENGESTKDVAGMISETDMLVLYADATFNFESVEAFAKIRDMPVELAQYIIDSFNGCNP